MTHAQILTYCLAKPGAYLDYPFGPDFAVVKVKAPSQAKGRIFAQPFILRGEPERSGRAAACVTLNCAPDAGDFWRQMFPGSVVRGWHCPPIHQPHFDTVSLDGSVPDDEIIRMIDHAYKIVVAKMPKYIQRELRGE